MLLLDFSFHTLTFCQKNGILIQTSFDVKLFFNPFPEQISTNKKTYCIFTRAAGDVLFIPLRVYRKGMVFMSTYEEFMILLATATLIVSILHLTHKK